MREFWTESQLVNGRCPDCGGEVKYEYAEEEAYFFRLSKYADRVRSLLTGGEFLEPASRVNEMVHNFIDCEGGLQDLCVSRTSFTWGVPVDFDPGHVVYVWIDALFNYATALGYENDKYHDFDKYWPADVHIVGKEIVRFHSIIWPAMLMSVGLPLPKHVYGHGWLVMDGGKMSKSKGNVVDPYMLAERYGVDALRFFLLRSFPSARTATSPTSFSFPPSTTISPTISATFSPARRPWPANTSAARCRRRRKRGRRTPSFSGCSVSFAAGTPRRWRSSRCRTLSTEVFRVIARANKYIDETAPWVLAKDEAKKPRLARVLYNLLETLRVCGTLLKPRSCPEHG